MQLIVSAVVDVLALVGKTILRFLPIAVIKSFVLPLMINFIMGLISLIAKSE